MPVDTHGLNPDHVGKKMRVELTSGELLEIRVHELTVCAKPEPCCGITYILLATNRNDEKREKGAAYWMAFGEIEKFKVFGRLNHMQPFSTHTGMVIPLDRVNVDTDQMVPKQFLKALTREGFGRILFYNNCFKNGILPATLSEAEVDELFKRTEKEEGYSLTVNLPNQTIADKHGLMFKFEIAPSRKEVLLKGLDDIGTTLQHEPDITAYEKTHAATATMYDAVDVKYYSNGR